MCWGPGGVRAGTYQAELGLKLYLQRLQGPLEFGDLTAGGVEGVLAGHHHFVQLVKLGTKQRQGDAVEV